MALSKATWQRLSRLVTTCFFIAILVMMVIYARKTDWSTVWQVIHGYNRKALLSACALVILSYLIYGGYDLMARARCGHFLAKRQVMLVAFICYAFNLTLSAWVGGIGMRYRLYARLGLKKRVITRIFSLSITTNWIGYILLGGILFTVDTVPLPPRWYVNENTLRLLGIGLLAIILIYLWACARAKKRSITLRGHMLELPDLRFALIQIALSSANWAIMAAIIWLLIGSDAHYPLVLGVLLISSIAGVIVHIPAGIGVLETVFITLLAGEHITHGKLIAALIAYRVLYFFIPLLLATFSYLWLESQAKTLRVKNQEHLTKK